MVCISRQKTHLLKFKHCLKFKMNLVRNFQSFPLLLYLTSKISANVEVLISKVSVSLLVSKVSVGAFVSRVSMRPFATKVSVSPFGF